MAVELATGYVSLTTEAATLTRDIQTALRRATTGLTVDLGEPFGDLAGDARAQARSAANEFEAGFKIDIDPITTDFDITGDQQLADLRGDISRVDGQNINIDVEVGDADTSGLVSDISDAGEDAASGFLGSFQPPLLGGILAIGAGAAAILVGSISAALGREQQLDVLAGSLGLTPAEAEAAGELIGSITGQAYGDSFEDVVGTYEVAAPLDTGDLGQTIIDLENLETAFGGNAEEYSALLSVLDSRSIADVEFGTDLIIAGLQQVPVAFRDAYSEAITEYAPFAAELGLQGEEIFSLFAGLADGGEFFLDKGGDALKEFTILVGEQTDDVVATLDGIGLAGDDIAGRLAAGGPAAREAFEEVVEGLLSIEDPVDQANAAIALFGPPLEDLGRNEIPAFLEDLQSIDDGLLGVGDASAELDQTLNDNISTRLSTLFRGLQETLVDVGEAFTPAIDGAIGFVEEFQEVLGEDGLGAAFDFAIDEFGELYAKAEPFLLEFVDEAKAFLADVVGPELAAGLEVAGEALVDWIAPKIPGMLLAAAEGFAELFRYLTVELPVELGQSFSPAVQQFPQFANNAAQAAADAIVEKIGDIAAAGADFALGLLDGAVGIVEGDVIPFFQGLPGDAIDALGDVGSLLFSVGQDVINGLFDGLKDKWVGVKSWLDARASEIKNVFTSALGINSPSTVMMDVGQDTMVGFRLGLEAEEPAIDAALAGIVDATISAGVAITPFIPETGGASTGGSSSARTINVDMTYGNEAELYQAISRQERSDDALHGRFAFAGDRDI